MTTNFYHLAQPGTPAPVYTPNRLFPHYTGTNKPAPPVDNASAEQQAIQVTIQGNHAAVERRRAGDDSIRKVFITMGLLAMAFSVLLVFGLIVTGHAYPILPKLVDGHLVARGWTPKPCIVECKNAGCGCKGGPWAVSGVSSDAE